MKALFAFISGLLFGVISIIAYIGMCMTDRNWRHALVEMFDKCY